MFLLIFCHLLNLFPFSFFFLDLFFAFFTFVCSIIFVLFLFAPILYLIPCAHSTDWCSMLCQIRHACCSRNTPNGGTLIYIAYFFQVELCFKKHPIWPMSSVVSIAVLEAVLSSTYYIWTNWILYLQCSYQSNTYWDPHAYPFKGRVRSLTYIYNKGFSYFMFKHLKWDFWESH